jgi:serine/threonine protein kinase/TPR repeat protein
MRGAPGYSPGFANGSPFFFDRLRRAQFGGLRGAGVRCKLGGRSPRLQQPQTFPARVFLQTRYMFRFGHYEVLETSDGSPLELGRGAMGITYKALDTALQRNVALKVINPDNLAGEEARQRFLREARAAAQLKHPNVASIFHLGEDGGTHFYAMEFIDGETLESLVQRLGPLPCGLALDITAQVAAALEAAHAENLVHRDIKPANLMIVQDAQGRITVKVIDFGLAKIAGHAVQRDATITVGGFLGTPHFASPEQLEEKDVDIRSDIYSLGATLWHMLTARTLFAGSLVRVMIGQISELPPFDRLEAPPEILALLRSMLAKDPTERPQTPGDLLAQIREAAPTIDPEFICGSANLSGENWSGFTLQELLRVRRVLPPGEALVLLKRLAETLDAIGPLGVDAIDLRLHAIAIDFARPPTASPNDSMLLSISEWPAFNIKFRNIGSVGQTPLETSDSDETVLAAAQSHAGGYVHRLASLLYELLGGKLRNETEFVPLAALSERGNTVLECALSASQPGAYETGAEFHAAMESADESSTPLSKQPANAAAHPVPLEFPDAETPPHALAMAPLAQKRRHPIRATLIAVLLAGVVAAGILWVRHGSPTTFTGLKSAILAGAGASSPAPALASVTARQKPPASPASATPRSTPRPPASPAPTPAPVPNREQRLKMALLQMADNESAGDEWNALESAVRLAKDFPEYDPRLSHLDETLLKLRDSGSFKHDWRAYAPVVNEASELGSSEAMLIMGEHVRKNQPERALALFRASAEKGVAPAMVEVGLMYLHGESVAQDAREAEKWFTKASDANDPSGTLILAECYLAGRSVKQDIQKAVQLLKDASEHHSGDAKNVLGKMYLFGLEGFPVNRVAALELFREARELNCGEAFYNVGVLNLASRTPFMNPGRAASLFRRGAELGNALCMFYYGKCLEEGVGVPASGAEAAQWCAKAADSLRKEADEGSRPAALCYAMCLEGGKGVERDPTGATKLYTKAASLGDPTAAKWCNDHRVPFRINTSIPGQGVLFLPRAGINFGNAPGVKAP